MVKRIKKTIGEMFGKQETESEIFEEIGAILRGSSDVNTVDILSIIMSWLDESLKHLQVIPNELK